MMTHSRHIGSAVLKTAKGFHATTGYVDLPEKPVFVGKAWLKSAR